MNEEQKQRAAQMLRRFSQANPRTLSADTAAVDMAALLQELVDAPEQVAGVPDRWKLVCGDWKDATVAIHRESDGRITCGLPLDKATALIDAHNAAMLAAAPTPAEAHPDDAAPTPPEQPAAAAHELTLSSLRKKLGLPDSCAERRILCAIDRLLAIESAAQNLAKVKGRHNSEIAYNRLMEALK